MSKNKKSIALLLASILVATLLSGCASSRTENGVTIEEESSLKFW